MTTNAYEIRRGGMSRGIWMSSLIRKTRSLKTALWEAKSLSVLIVRQEPTFAGCVTVTIEGTRVATFRAGEEVGRDGKPLEAEE